MTPAIVGAGQHGRAVLEKPGGLTREVGVEFLGANGVDGHLPCSSFGAGWRRQSLGEALPGVSAIGAPLQILAQPGVDDLLLGRVEGQAVHRLTGEG